MSKSIDKLFPVLEMPEERQLKWAQKNLMESSSERWCTSLADLAFRLRDEAVNIRYSKLVSAMEKVAMKSAKALTSYDMEGFNEWFTMEAQPIDWIIAALIAKELAKQPKAVKVPQMSQRKPT